MTQLIIIEQNDNPNNIYMKMSTAFFIRYGLGFTYACTINNIS